MNRKTYGRYKSSGVEWLGEIPEHWRIYRVRHCIMSIKNGTTATQVDYETDHGVTRIETISKGIIDYDKIGYVEYDNSLKQYLLKKNDILLSHINSLEMVGNCAIYKGERNLYSGMNLLRLRPASTIEPFFFFWWLKSKNFIYAIQMVAKHAINQVSVPITSLKDIIVPFPPLPERHAIVTFLDRETTRIDELIAKKQRQIDLLQEKRSALISHVVTKGLDPDVKMKDSGVEWLGKIPESWEIRRLRYLGYCQNGINIGAEKFGTGYPFVSYGDVYNNSALPVVGSGLVESSDADRTRYSVETGDVFFTRTSETIEEIGFSSVCFKTILDAVFAGFLIRFRPVGKTLNIGFSELYFRSDHLRAFFVKEMNLVTRASLSQDLLKEMPVLLPPIDEQRAIAAFLDRETARIDSMVNKVNESIDLLLEYRTALISAAVTGKIDVREEVA